MQEHDWMNHRHIRDESIILGFEGVGVPKWKKLPTWNTSK